MNKNRLIVALDVETANEAREIINQLQGEVDAFKIGLQLFTAAGASFVREAVATGAKIFLDLKFHDIPNTTAQAAIEIARMRVWMFNVHALGGAEMMRQTAESVREVCEKENLKPPKIIGVTVLTSSNQEILRGTGIETEIGEQVVKLARLAANCGLDGVVASPLEISLIRENIKDKNFLIVTPGIRAGFATNDDQKRVMTASEAVRAGSDYLVVGRPILQARDRQSAARKILEEIAF
ncbi:MAG: orotidine-5'-phosphate decarboxylase [Acidobacteriota bacterium]|nr:orotidine-5'-phosphate decarboxylase [Acidobacteriota bacterium]